MTRLLQVVVLFAGRRYRAVFAVMAALVLLSGWAASRLELDTDVLNLLPQREPLVKTFRETMEEFGSADYLLVVVRIPEGEALEPYEAFADELAGRLSRLESIESVDYRIGEVEELLEEFLPKAFLFLESRGREAVAQRLTDEALRQRAAEIRRLLATPQALALKPLVKTDPLGLSLVFLEQLQAGREGLALDWTRGYFLSRDHQRLLILAKPILPAQNIDFSERLETEALEAVAAARAEWGRIAGPHSLPPPEVGLGGTYLIALDDARFIRQDIVVNVLSSMGGVLLLFLFAFRRPAALACAFLPLAAGLLLTFGFASALYGTLGAATSGVAALLIGLGIDFVIVSYGRYVEERRRGADLAQALAAMSGSSYRAVVLGAVTTAATFYAFLVTEFRGLRQMGVLTGTGILFCLVTVLLLLPAMLAWSEARHRRRQKMPTLYLYGFGADRLMRASLRHPLVVLGIGLAVTVAAAILAPGIEFEDSVRKMRPAGNRGVQVQDEVIRHFGTGFDYMMLVIGGETPEEVVAIAGRAAAGARELVEAGILTGYDAISSVIPPPARQAAALEWLARERQGRLEMTRVRATFAAALAEQGLRLAPFEPGLALLAEAVATTEPITAADLEGSPQGRRLLERYLQPTDEGWKSVVYLHPPGRVWKRAAPPQVERLAAELGPRVVLTGGNIISEYIRAQVRTDAIVAALLGLVLVAILLWLDFRTLRETALALAPLLVGILWMLGGMAALDLPMNFMNIFVSTMVIGIGVDYGIHVLHRYREGKGSREALEQGVVETGKAIVLAALSTIVGFGSLWLSHYPGLKSMGLVAIMGALSTSLVAITLLPAYLALRAGAGDAEEH